MLLEPPDALDGDAFLKGLRCERSLVNVQVDINSGNLLANPRQDRCEVLIVTPWLFDCMDETDEVVVVIYTTFSEVLT
jgi:hypothetical protein